MRSIIQVSVQQRFSLSALYLSPWNVTPAGKSTERERLDSAVRLQGISRHSHLALQLSGLTSSRRVRPCLPSGLLRLLDADDTIMPNRHASELKQTPRINAHEREGFYHKRSTDSHCLFLDQTIKW